MILAIGQNQWLKIILSFMKPIPIPLIPLMAFHADLSNLE